MVSFKKANPKRIGHLLFSGGGKGEESASQAVSMLERSRFDEPIYWLNIDTDVAGEKTLADDHIGLGISHSEVVAMKANMECFDPVVAQIFQAIGEMFGPVELGFGARTCPAMTQLMWEYRKPDIIKSIRKSIDILMQRCERIRIYIVHSTGGGSGRAIGILLPILLADPTWRRKILYGYDSQILDTPISIAGFPINHPRHDATELQGRKILANHVAWAIESDALLRDQKLAYVFHVGYSNNNAVNNTSAKLTEVMAGTVHDVVFNYPYLNARMVDSKAPVNSGYSGVDLPSTRFMSVAQVRDQFYPKKGEK